MAHLTVVADFTAKADKIDQAKAELLKLVEPTRAENGCVSYVLHEDNEKPAHFVFFETWTTPEALQAHMETDHFKHFVAQADDLLEHFSVHQMTAL